MTTSFLPLKQPLTNASLWHIVDAKGFKVGQLATHLARVLMGKHKPTYNPAAEGGDYVVVVNAEKVLFTGDKWSRKLYRWHTGYPGGLKEVRAQDMLFKHPDSIIRRAVSRMLPKNKLRQLRLEKLKVYVGDDHPHGQQAPRNYRYEVTRQQRILEDATGQQQKLSQMRAQVLEDPEAFVNKYGGGIISLEQADDGRSLVITASKVKGTHEHAVPTFGNTRSLRARRMQRLQDIVQQIQQKQQADLAKRDPL